MLAAAVASDFSGLVYDVGAGVGAVGLAVALVRPDAQVILVENDAACAALAASNIVANGLEARVEVAGCDILSREDRGAWLPRAADLIVTNPPFHRADRVRASADPGRRAAHVMGGATSLEDWLHACLACVAAKGTFVVLHQAEAVPEILQALSQRLGDITLMPIYPRSDQQAVRVLVRGRKGSRAPFRVAAPLILHEGDTFTAEAAALHAGSAMLHW